MSSVPSLSSAPSLSPLPSLDLPHEFSPPESLPSLSLSSPLSLSPSLPSLVLSPTLSPLSSLLSARIAFVSGNSTPISSSTDGASQGRSAKVIVPVHINSRPIIPIHTSQEIIISLPSSVIRTRERNTWETTYLNTLASSHNPPFSESFSTAQEVSRIALLNITTGAAIAMNIVFENLPQRGSLQSTPVDFHHRIADQ